MLNTNDRLKAFSRIFSKRVLLVVTAVLAAIFVLAACAAPVEEEEQVLRVAWGSGPVTLDPLSASADVEIAILNATYDYLIDTNAQSELEPRLAREWAVSDNGLAYTLTLAEGVTWHDGSDFSASDVVWTFDRLQSNEGSAADLYANVTSVEAPDDTTVVFTLENPNPDFLLDIADNKAVILKEGAEEIGTEFNGTGPFVLESFSADDRAVFVANEDYFDGAPEVDRLEMVFFADSEAAVNALRSGTVDVVLRVDNATFLTLSEEEFTTEDIPTNGHDLVRLRQDQGPGEDPRVVQAFKMATDRDAIFERVQLGFGAVGRDTPIGPLYAQYYLEDPGLPEYDPAGAAALLADAGYEDGLEMTLYVPAGGDREALAQALASQWEEANILVDIEVVEESTYYGTDQWLEVDLGITGWGSRPTPQFYLNTAYKTDAVWNETKISDPELDELIDVAGSTTDEGVRTEAYQDIQRILVDRGSAIIPYFFAAYGVYGPGVEGVQLHPFPGRTNFDQASVTPASE